MASVMADKGRGVVEMVLGWRKVWVRRGVRGEVRRGARRNIVVLEWSGGWFVGVLCAGLDGERWDLGVVLLLTVGLDIYRMSARQRKSITQYNDDDAVFCLYVRSRSFIDDSP